MHRRGDGGGTIPSLAYVPAWVMPGVPLSVLGLPCLGTAWTRLPEHPVRTVVIGFRASVQVLVAAVNMIGDVWDNGLASPAGAFAPVNLGPRCRTA